MLLVLCISLPDTEDSGLVGHPTIWYNPRCSQFAVVLGTFGDGEEEEEKDKMLELRFYSLGGLCLARR